MQPGSNLGRCRVAATSQRPQQPYFSNPNTHHALGINPHYELKTYKILNSTESVPALLE